VRWRIVDAAQGQQESDCTAGSGASQVVVDQVELMVADSAGKLVACPSCTFPCGPLEGTTAFALPTATYAFTLRALASCQSPLGFTPPTVTRSVKAGEITNLGAIEILIPAGTTDPCTHLDGGP
jgi:hypothetical protein